MPQRILSGDILVVRAWCANLEQASVNTFYYRALNPTGLGPLDTDAAAQIDAWYAPFYKPCISSRTTYHGVSVQIHRLIANYYQAVSTANQGVGTAGAEDLPRQCSALTTWRTELAGPAFRGRTYWPFPPDQFDIGDGKITPAGVTTYGALANRIHALAFIGDNTNSIQISMCLRNKPVKNQPWTLNTITFGETGNQWATMRKRGFYGQPNRTPF
jgi:hypothetical protein